MTSSGIHAMQMSAAEREALRERMQELRQVGIDVREAVRGELAQGQGGAPLPPLPPLPGEIPAPGTPQGMPQETWTMVPPRNQDIPDIPPGVQDISIAFFAMIAICVVGFPLARAIGRRIEGRMNQPAVALSPELGTQLLRIEQAVDAMAIEVERISESQRYLTRLQSERDALPASRHQG